MLQQAVANNNGELLQHIGDGSLTMFQSAVQAVTCAIDLQRTLREEPLVAIRTGIHLGDVVIEPDSIYGDGVNIASRIEQLADPGSILITQSIYESIKNQRKFRVNYLGSLRLRNVMAPTRVYAIRNRGIVVPERLTRRISIDLRSLTRTGAVLVTLLVLSLVAFAVTHLFGNKKDRNGHTTLPELVVSTLNFTSSRADTTRHMMYSSFSASLKTEEQERFMLYLTHRSVRSLNLLQVLPDWQSRSWASGPCRNTTPHHL